MKKESLKIKGLEYIDNELCMLKYLLGMYKIIGCYSSYCYISVLSIIELKYNTDLFTNKIHNRYFQCYT